MIRQIGYYWVKFYNYIGEYILYFDGNTFQSYKGQQLPNDEIESYKLVKNESNR